MAPLPPVPKVLRIAVIGEIGADVQVVNRFYMQYTGTPPDAGALNTFAQTILSSWALHISPLQAPQYATESCEVIDLTSSSAAAGEYTSANTGTRTGEPVDPATCAVIQHKIGRRYRGGHCRTYLFAGTQADKVNPQTWNPAFVSSLANGWGAFIADIVTAGWTGAGDLFTVNVSYFHGYTNVTYPSGRVRAVPLLRPVPQVDPVLDNAANGQLASQRRRNLQRK